MKFFNWVQDKLNNAGPANKRPNVVPATSNQAKVEEPPSRREGYSDWSNGLLTIGTFGSRDQREYREIQQRGAQVPPESSINDDGIQGSSSPDELAEFTPEEVGKLQKELTRLLKRKPTTASTNAGADLPLDRFLNCPSSLEVDRTVSSRYSVNSSDYRGEEDIDRAIRAIIRRCKEVSMENKKQSIGKKSVSFLLKKMFVCTSGFLPSPGPSLRGTLQESRMEKLLRTMLSRQTYPQNASRASSTKRFLVDVRSEKAEKDDDAQDRKGEGCKWVKTDSEYIVLDLD